MTYTSITYPSPAAIVMPSDPELLEGYHLHVSRMLAGTGDMAWGFAPLVHAIFGARDVDPSSREVIALRVANLLRAPYMLQQHTTMGRNAGLRADEIDALASDKMPPRLPADHALLAVAAEELTVDAILTDESLIALQERYGPTVARKLILTISFFNLLGRFLNGTRVPLQTADVMGDRIVPF